MQPFQIASVRPPTENFSLSINTHYYCPWGKCAFCPRVLFKESGQFKRRSIEEVKIDIDNAAALNDYLLEFGNINQASLFKAISKYPSLSECIVHLVYWHLYTDGSTAFLGGANPLIYDSTFLVDIINHLRNTFPSIRRITSYGRTKTSSKKSVSYFKELHDAGLDRIHAGIESGSDNVLKLVNKGATSEEHIKGGNKIKEGGISLSIYIMPGLGGKKWSEEHALETARVVNELEPDYIRLRTLEVFQFTPLYSKLKSGEFQELSEEDVVKEERLFVENISCNTEITSDSAANLLTEIWGHLPRDKDKILRTIDDYLELNPKKKLEFSLKRRLEAYDSQYGGLSHSIEKKLSNLYNIPENDENYYKKMESVIKFIRSKLIP